MTDVGRHPNVELLVRSEVIKVEGEPGNFKVTVLKRASFVDWQACTTCGVCTEKCPAKVPSEFNLGINQRKAIYVPFPQAVPNKPYIDKLNCIYFKTGKCRVCEKLCPAKAIDFNMSDEHINLVVGSIVVATGVDYWNPIESSEYGYRRFKNVISSFELERYLDPASPTRGELPLSPSGQPPKRVAFIQCVGSRNMKADIDYCSRICCMNAIKDTLVIREHYPESEIFMFYIDIRAFGKGFEEFYRRSLDAGVKYIKGKPSKITENQKTGELVLAYEDQLKGEIKDLVVDLAVLSSAKIPSQGTKELANILGIDFDQDGFFKEKDPCSHPLESVKEGIYLCGCATSPKDITDSIAEACGAAAKAGVLIKDSPIEEKKEEITPLDLNGEPRVGVFICHCGMNISAVVNINTLRDYSATLPNVVFVDDYLFACAESVQKKIQEAISEHSLNRIVVAACTPKTHEGIFQDTLFKIGFNPYLFDMANIRNQCSWVHQKEPEIATDKAKEIIGMSVARVLRLAPLESKTLKVGRDMLVIGGGITGMQAAVDLANRGFKVYLVEKKQLGGRVRELANVYPSGKPGVQLIEEIEKKLKEKKVTIFTNAEIKNVKGFVGNFEVEIFFNNESKILSVGAIILAIGADLYKPLDKFGYGEYSNVYTSMELEAKLINNFEELKKLRSVVFIQCVGSRAEVGNTWCSRYCCQSAIKQAILLRKLGIDVTIFHRGIRVYSKGAEVMYREARELGVLFIPYSELAKGEIPEVIGKEGLASQVEMELEALGGRIIVPVDAVFLSVGMVPNNIETTKLADLLKVPRGPDLFFLERHSKFGPVETTVEGVFLAGCCQFPQDIGDSISQASAVASKAASLLSRDIIIMPPITSAVDETYCRGCGRCAEVCEFHAIELFEKEKGIYVARVNEALCKGCGTCVPACPTGAIDLKHFKKDQIEAQLKALFS